MARTEYGPSFKVTPHERELIERIVARVMASRVWVKGRKRGELQMEIEMDITATHCNGNPLDLERLLAADEFNFWHDINGIHQHIDRTTGKLLGHFRPRFTTSEAARVTAPYVGP